MFLGLFFFLNSQFKRSIAVSNQLGPVCVDISKTKTFSKLISRDMASNQSLRQRPGKGNSAAANSVTDGNSKDSNEIVLQKINEAKQSIQSEWEYKVALLVVTLLAFLTRFYGISHPNQVVFDEVHFGKVSTILYLKRAESSLSQDS